MADEESINFMDLACVLRITSETTLEKFGSVINSSVFDAANISGTLKQKGLVDFTAYYPGPNSIVLTEAGKNLKTEADAKSTAPLDDLDKEVLTQLSGGKRAPLDLQNTLNIRPKDLALRIYKLFKQNFVSYELGSGNATLMLTEQGFLQAKSLQTHAQVQTPGQMMPVQQQGKAMGQGSAQTPEQKMAAAQDMKPKKKFPMKYVLAVIVILILVGAALYYLHFVMHAF